MALSVSFVMAGLVPAIRVLPQAAPVYPVDARIKSAHDGRHLRAAGNKGPLRGKGDMNKEETLALWRQGRDAWNAWAKEMLDRRAAMEEAGTWSASRDWPPEKGNKITDGWMAAAAADFAAHVDASADFTGSVFPGRANFSEATFQKDAYFNSATFSGDAQFGSATFNKNGNAVFLGVTFGGSAQFAIVRFGGALFTEATFGGTAEFASATFRGMADFQSATFNRHARFYRTTFSESAHAVFAAATFSGTAEFASATFSGDTGFTQSHFNGYTNFASARFRRADFTAAQGERGFTLEGARFAEVPDFSQAHFAEAPRLDNVSIPEVGGLARLLFPFLPGIEADVGTAARYRALKRLAIQAHDHTRELEYFANELKALRGHPDTPLPCPLNLLRKDEEGKRLPWWPGGCRGTAQYWFGIGYEMRPCRISAGRWSCRLSGGCWQPSGFGGAISTAPLLLADVLRALSRGARRSAFPFARRCRLPASRRARS